jgi:hypothetical protein
MIKKIYIFAIPALMLCLAAFSWAATPHKDFAEMKINECNECHQSQGAKLSHGGYWLNEHKLAANSQTNNCKDCHQQSFCLDCHKGGGIDRDLHVSNSGPDYMPSTHRTDFREMHPLKAKENQRSCLRCHDNKKFCGECHSKFSGNAIMNDSHRRQFRDIPLSSIGPIHASFSPAECGGCHVSGVLPHNQWSQAHAREARRNLSSCQTCHADGDVCMKCHSALTGLKINPHPRNWSRISGRLKSSSNNRTCVKCHIN